MMKILLLTLWLFLSAPALAAEETAYDRVMRTQTIRCGYFVGDPYFIKDPNSGALSGIWHDYLEAVGKALHFKIEWTEEIGLGDFGAALDSGRIDAMCLGIWVDPGRAKAADYVTPISYHAAYMWTREDDTRFDNAFDRINAEDVTITYLDGDIAEAVVAEDFPKAKRLTLPQLSSVTQALDNVATKKADVAIFTPEIVAQYNKSHDVKLHRVKMAHPIRIFPESIAVKKGEDKLRRLLDYTTQFLIGNGKIDRILNRYESVPGSFMRTAKPYEVTQ